MMETPPPEPTTSPLPWIGAEKALSSAAQQAWAASMASIALIGVAYRNSRFDRWRSFVLLLGIRWYLLLPNVLLGTILVIVANINLIQMSTGVAGRLFAILLLVTVGMAISVAALFFLAAALYAVIVLLPPYKQSDRTMTYLLPHAVYDREGSKVTEILWGNIAQLHDFGGDLFFVERFLWGGKNRSIYIPRSVFADRESARRFYDAAVMLSKADGTPVMLTPAVIAEFPPPP